MAKIKGTIVVDKERCKGLRGLRLGIVSVRRARLCRQR